MTKITLRPRVLVGFEKAPKEVRANIKIAIETLRKRKRRLPSQIKLIGA